MDNRSYLNVTSPWTPAPPEPYWLNQPYQPEPDYASFWRRFFAACIDGILLSIVFKILDAISNPLMDEFVALPDSESDAGIVLIGYLGFVVSVFALYVAIDWLYHAILECSEWQATLGKTFLGIVVTDLAGNRITFGRASARYFARWLSLLTLLIGYLIQPFTSRRQTLHDLIARTLVLRRETPSNSTAAVPSGEPPAETDPLRGMSRVAMGAVLGGLVVIIGGASISYMVAIPKIRDYIERTERRTTEQIAATISAQVSVRIGPGSAGRELNLRARDLDINNGYGPPNELGVSWDSDEVIVYGFETTIDRSGIMLGGGLDVNFRFMPSIRGGQVALSTVGETDAPTSFIFSPAIYERGLEDGINRALASNGLQPTSVVLGQGSVTIKTEPLAESETLSARRESATD